MKKSNLFLLSALLIFALSILAFDFGLRAQYAKGDFRMPYSQYNELPYSNFDTVRINASTIANVKFVQGPFNVRVFDAKAHLIKLSQRGRVLTIDVNTNEDRYEDSHYALVISCPQLKQVLADDRYIQNGKVKIDTNAKYDFYYDNRLVHPAKKILIEGFRQDSMNLIQSNGSHVALESNRITNISAVVGVSTKSASFLTINETNTFRSADLDIRNRSQLFLSKASINDLDFNLAPEAKITYSGASSVLFR